MDMRIIQLLAERRRSRAREHWTRKALEEYQARALRLVRAYAYANSPFYQQFHKGLYDAPLTELPVLTKGIVMDHFDDLVTDRAVRLRDIQAYMATGRADRHFLGRYRVHVTSGSSGHPGVFLVNRAESTTAMASGARLFEWMGIKITHTHRVKTASIASTLPFHLSAQRGSTFRRLVTPRIQLAASEKVSTIVERLNAWQPELLTCYASVLRILADEQLAGRLRIAPRAVLGGGEVLTKETRRRAVQAWGDVVFNTYVATEGVAGVECNEHRGMHLLEDRTIVEVVDQDNRPVPPGTYGDKLLITPLFKCTQPLIRYEISDSVCLSPDPCPCGRPFRLVEDIQGRVEEVLLFAGEAGGSVMVHPLVFDNIMDMLPVNGWQIVHEVDGVLVLLSGVRGPLDDAVVASDVAQALAKQGVIVPSVKVQRVTRIPQSEGGKTPLVRSNL